MDKTESTVIAVLRDIQTRINTLESKIDVISKTLGAEFNKIEDAIIPAKEMASVEKDVPAQSSTEERTDIHVLNGNISRRGKKVVKIIQGAGVDERGFITVEDILANAKRHSLQEHAVKDTLDELHRLGIITDPVRGELQIVA